MEFKDLMTWPWARASSGAGQAGEEPFRVLQAEINRAFDQVLRAMPTPRMHADWGMSLDSLDLPIDLVETDTAIEIEAEVPGILEEDIEVAIGGDALTITAMKRPPRDENGRDHRIHERRFGAFRRSVRLPAAVDEDRVTAMVSNGVLTITVPKLEPAIATALKKIPISRA